MNNLRVRQWVRLWTKYRMLGGGDGLAQMSKRCVYARLLGWTKSVTTIICRENPINRVYYVAETAVLALSHCRGLTRPNML